MKNIKLFQITFNTFIRVRDKDLPCISCGKFRELQAGHYVPQKTSAFLVMHEWNVNGECAGCNSFDRFHLIPYRENLIKKIGLENVIWLEENRHAVKRWTIQELTEIIEKYTI